MCIGLHVKCPLFSSDFNENCHFLDRFSKNTQISNFVKIQQLGAGSFHEDGRTDRQTDITKLIVAFRNFVNAPKNKIHFLP